MQSNRSPLQQRQEKLIEIIFSGEGTTNDMSSRNQTKGLRIYQNNLRLTAAQVLSLSYPVIEQMLGQQAIRVLSRTLLLQELPDSGNWADWGGQLASLINSSPLSEDHPYLADTARLEWSLHQAAIEEATVLDTESLSILTKKDLSDVYLHLSPTLHLLRSPYAVDELWRLHKQPENEQAEAPDSASIFRTLMQSQTNHYIVIYQKDHLPCCERLSPEEFYWIKAIKAGDSLDSLLSSHPDIDFSQWLTRSIKQQWLEKLS